MKKLMIALGAAAVLSLALFGCAGSGSGSNSSSTSSSSTNVEQSASASASKSEASAPAASENGGVDNAAAKYGLNIEGTEVMPMGDERQDRKTLGPKAEELNKAESGMMTYDEVVAAMGLEPNEYDPVKYEPKITFRWICSDLDVTHVEITFVQDKDGVWKNSVVSWNFA